MRSWLSDVREHADPHLTCILVANKVDLCEEGSANARPRQVSKEEAELWAKEEQLDYIEASARTGVNVDEAFTRAVSLMLLCLIFESNNECSRLVLRLERY